MTPAGARSAGLVGFGRGAALLALLLCFSTGCDREGAKGTPAGQGAAATPPEPIVELLFTYGSEKQAWIEDVTAAFNAGGVHTAAGKKIQVTAVPQGSGECIDELLAGRREAHLTSPASAAYVELGNAASRAKTGGDLLPAPKNLVLSPVVIAMWEPMARALGWPDKPVGWGEILALARDPQGWSSRGNSDWGAFRYGHTHPEYSNSGLIAVLAEAYAAAGKRSGLAEADVARPEVAQFVEGIEQAVVHYGSSTKFFADRMFAGGPSTSAPRCCTRTW